MDDSFTIILGLMMVMTFFLGVALLIAGIAFLVVHCTRKDKEKNGLLITSIIMIAFGVPMAVFLPLMLVFAEMDETESYQNTPEYSVASEINVEELDLLQ